MIMEEELMRVRCTSGNANAGAGPSTSTREEPQRETENTAEWEDRWRRAIRRCYERMDEVAVSTCACGSVGCDCAAHSMEVALSGSTAVVALLTSEHIIVANCGDSRAVLCRAGGAIPLSCDHKVISSRRYGSASDVGQLSFLFIFLLPLVCFDNCIHQVFCHVLDWQIGLLWNLYFNGALQSILCKIQNYF